MLAEISEAGRVTMASLAIFGGTSAVAADLAGFSDPPAALPCGKLHPRGKPGPEDRQHKAGKRGDDPEIVIAFDGLGQTVRQLRVGRLNDLDLIEGDISGKPVRNQVGAAHKSQQRSQQENFGLIPRLFRGGRWCRHETDIKCEKELITGQVGWS